MTRVLLLAASCIGIAIGCSDDPARPDRHMSPQARAYLDEIVGIMREHSLHRFEIDWDHFEERVFGAAPDAQSIADTRLAIREALALLGDGHSHYRASDGTTVFVPTRACTGTPSSLPPIPAGIGYVRVEGFGGSGTAAAAFAARLQGEIATQDHEDPIGWIVDVRRNGGGNMWPMIAGLGPILGEAVLGHFVYPDGESMTWEYRDGAARLEGDVLQAVADPHALLEEQPRVAVLTDGRIASSGEAVVIAFRGRPNARSFGAPTCGLSTANLGFPLSDGAVLVLTVAVMADRTGAEYGGPLVPDEGGGSPEGAVLRAIEWLQEAQ